MGTCRGGARRRRPRVSREAAAVAWLRGCGKRPNRAWMPGEREKRKTANSRQHRAIGPNSCWIGLVRRAAHETGCPV
jgi:hypothetical protein